MGMNRIHAHWLGLAFAIFLAVWHSLWSLLVWVGGAQWLIDFIFRLHMITPPYKIAPFSFGIALSLVVVTTCFGYMVGFLIGIIWNRCALGSVGN
jgi:hypothetical protein